MANYQGKVRSNYFAVKNADDWVAFCDRFEFESIMMWDSEIQSNLYGFMDGPMSDGRGLPSDIYDEDEDEMVEVDFIAELAEQLDPDAVAIIMEIGWEKMRYFIGIAIAVNAKGDHVSVSLDDIYDKADDAFEGESSLVAD